MLGDAFYYKDKLRDGATYNWYIPKEGEDTSQYWGDNFNSGLILFDGRINNTKSFSRIDIND